MAGERERHETAIDALIRMLFEEVGLLGFATVEDAISNPANRELARRLLLAAVGAAADARVMALLHEDVHVCTCGADAVCRGCSEGFEDRCSFEAVLRALVGERRRG